MDQKVKFIIEKVCKLYQTYGIKSITMDDVARELGYSKKTLYQFFSDKSELVKAVVEKEFNQKNAEFEKAMADQNNAIEEVFGYYKIQITMLREYKPSFMFDLQKYYKDVFDQIKSKKQKRILATMLANLKRGKKEGLYRKCLNEDIISRMHLVRMDCIMSSGMFSTEEIISPEFFTELFKYHLFGIVSEKGRAFLIENLDRLFEEN